MALLGRRYPEAQIVITGALGADSNAHVPDEWLNIPFAGQITEAVAYLLDAHAQNYRNRPALPRSGRARVRITAVSLMFGA